MRESQIRGFPHMMVGYMRVSSDGDRQTTALQRDALLSLGVVIASNFSWSIPAVVRHVGRGALPQPSPP